MTKWSGTKRFYTKVGIVEKDNSFCISLDGVSVKTPGGALLCVPNKYLAEAMAEEWDSQVNEVDPNIMPICKLSATAIDKVSKSREDIVGIVLKMAETDLLCYRAEEPPELVALQDKSWQPELDWLKREFEVNLKVTSGILPIIQPENSLLVLERVLCDLDNFTLMGLSNVSAATGSLVLALSLLKGRIGAKEIFQKSVLEEEFQMKKWGKDEEAIKRHNLIKSDILKSEKFLNLLEK